MSCLFAYFVCTPSAFPTLSDSKYLSAGTKLLSVLGVTLAHHLNMIIISRGAFSGKTFQH